MMRKLTDTIYFRMLLAHSQLCYSFSDTDRIGSLECVKRTSPLLIDAAKHSAVFCTTQKQALREEGSFSVTAWNPTRKATS